MLAKNFPVTSLAQADDALGRPGSRWRARHSRATMRELFLLARAHGERTFVVYRDERASYEAFARAALAIAAALQQAGVQSDRVGIAICNLPEWLAAVFGRLLSGGLNGCGAKIGIVDRERLERIDELKGLCVAYAQ